MNVSLSTRRAFGKGKVVGRELVQSSELGIGIGESVSTGQSRAFLQLNRFPNQFKA